MIKNSILSSRYLLWIPSILIFSFLLFLSFRGIVLRKALNSANSRLREHNYTAHFDGAEFRGISRVIVKGIYLEHPDSRNEIVVDSLVIRIRLAPLILKKISIRNLECRKILVRYNTDSLAVPANKVPEPDTTGLLEGLREKNLAGIGNNYIRRFFRYVPAHVRIGLLEARLSFADETTVVGLRELNVERGEFTAGCVFSGGGSSLVIPLTGHISRSKSQADMVMINPGRKLLPMPILKDKYGIEAGFDSLGFTVNMADRSHHLVNFNGIFTFSGFVLQGDRLSTSSIRIQHFKSSYLLHLGEHSLELDSTSSLELNRINLRPYFRIGLEEESVVEIKVLPVTWKAGDFFRSLPEGMFTSLPGLNADGKLKYHLNFLVNLDDPDSLKFETFLGSEEFRIQHFGTDDYRILNGDFLYRFYDRGIVKASFLVGPENPDFVAFDQISPYLRAAVMTSEDGSFFHHNGFNPGAFRESIVTNLKEKRFARGGSTISMQLVKNVFLTRNKTLARKIEEALIVWLIENQNLVSKQRMYEVYLNIIEWGPGIYGINQASRFYFNKLPKELTLQESVYLASIVPHPRWYKYTFETNGTMKPFFVNYFRRLEQLMVKKQFIAPGDTLGVPVSVVLTGPASQIFSTPDSVRTDSIWLKELELIPATLEL
jgi:hypothetical protein